MPKKTAVEQRLDDLCEKIDDGFERMEKALKEHRDDDKETFKNHNGRLATLEQAHATFSGKTAIIAFILMLLGSSTTAAVVKYILP